MRARNNATIPARDRGFDILQAFFDFVEAPEVPTTRPIAPAQPVEDYASASGLDQLDASCAEVAPAAAVEPASPTPAPVQATDQETPAPTQALARESQEDLSGITQIAPVKPVALVTARDVPAWPMLDEAVHASFTGPVSKYEANLQALALLRILDAECRSPSELERDILNRYTGWGGLKEIFEPNPLPEWRERANTVRKLLGEQEFAAARGSVVNAHYTEISVIKAMWHAITRMGFQGGRILEPSAGAGYFLGAMPQDVAMRSDIHAVELDQVSAQLLKTLYGQAATVVHGGFETTNYPDEWFDLVIGNVPFGNYRVACPRKRAYSSQSIHNYFLGRSLDLVRPRGIVAIVTSSYFMDARDAGFRSYVASRASLIGAIRLPVKAFSRIANTDVVTDIVFFQRHAHAQTLGGTHAAWTTVTALPDSHIPPGVARSHTEVNEYWGTHPQMVIGQWTVQRGMYRTDLAPVLAGQDLHTELEQRVSALPQEIYAGTDQPVDGTSTPETSEHGHPDGHLASRGGRVMAWRAGRFEDAGLSGKAEARALGLIALRDHTRTLLNAQSDPTASDSHLAELRQELNLLYDTFVRSHGCVSARPNTRVFRGDPDWPLIISLEKYDEETDTAEKAAIFHARTGFPSAPPAKADSLEDAVAISAAETGTVNPDYIARMVGSTGDKVIEQMLDEGLAFLNPETGFYESREQYLSGNVRAKRASALAAGDRFSTNVAALTAAIPPNIEPHEIDARLGVAWVSEADYSAFIRALCGDSWSNYSEVKVRRDPVTGGWDITGNIAHLTPLRSTWGTVDVDAVKIIHMALNGRSITVRDPVDDNGTTRYVVNVEKTAAARECQAKIEARFQEWLWEDDQRRDRLVTAYNEACNCLVERKWDGSRLRLPGYSWVLKPDAHQLNAAARIASGANTLLAHVVGAGKSLTMAIGAMEMRRLGTARKPLHVIPNHMLLQYAAEFMRAYPTARLLVATKEDLQAERRKAFCARVATGDWDSIVMTHSTFEKVQCDPKIVERLIERTLGDIRAAKLAGDGADRSIIKQLVKMEKDWTARLERLKAMWKKDDFLTLSDLGVDAILVDEAHCFKNLFRFSQMDRVAGLPANNSQRAFDMLVKTMQVMALRGGREQGVVFATGTPVANSMAEMHVMQRYLQPNTLERHGLAQFDSWAAQFGRVVTSLEVSPDGSSFRMNQRFAQFVNLPELLSMFGQVADIQTKEMLNLPTPKLATGDSQVVSVEPSAELKAYINVLVERAEAIRNGAVTPDIDNMLAVTNDGRKAALDLRLINPDVPFDPNGKIAACARKVHELWIKTADFRGTQLVFSDLGTPSGTRFNVYDDLRGRLVALGIPKDQIAFIHDAATDAAKEQLFAKVREGRVRVLIGSTSKMGVGTNVQKRLYALHQLDAPWRPADVEQREGRIARRGNECEQIEMFRYVTSGSFDAYIWQTLAAKARFIGQVMAGDRALRRAEDAQMTALSYEEVKAIACGNPAVREKAMLDAEYRKLCMLRNHHRRTQWLARNIVSGLPSRLEGLRRDAAAAQADLDTIRHSHTERLEFEGQGLEDPSAIADHLGAISKAHRGRAHNHDEVVAHYRGLPIKVVPSRGRDWGDYRFVIGERLELEIRPYLDGGRLLQEIRDAVGGLADFVGRKHAQIESAIQSEALHRVTAEKPFEHEARLEEITTRLRILDLELGLVKDMEGTQALDENSVVANNAGVECTDAAQEEAIAEPA